MIPTSLHYFVTYVTLGMLLTYVSHLLMIPTYLCYFITYVTYLLTIASYDYFFTLLTCITYTTYLRYLLSYLKIVNGLNPGVIS